VTPRPLKIVARCMGGFESAGAVAGFSSRRLREKSPFSVRAKGFRSFRGARQLGRVTTRGNAPSQRPLNLMINRIAGILAATPSRVAFEMVGPILQPEPPLQKNVPPSRGMAEWL